MSNSIENLKKIKQIGPNSFLFYFDQQFYFISFEIIEILNIKINIIKIEKSETHIFQAIIQFDSLGTDDISPEDTLQTITFLINNLDFSINEELNKITLIINSKNKALIEFFLYKGDKDNTQTKKKEYINNMQSIIQDLLNTISNQEQRINELRNREENHKNLLNKIEQITNNINTQLDNESKNNNNNNERNNNPYNPYNNQYNNNIYRTNRAFTMRNSNYDNSMIGNINNNNNSNIKIQTKVVYNPYLPDSTNMNNLLTRPEYRPPPPKPKMEKLRTINLDEIGNYKP